MAARKKEQTEQEWKPVRQYVPKGAYSDSMDPQFRMEKAKAAAILPVALHTLMRRRGITPERLGQQMGVSTAAVKHRLSARTDFGAAELRALAEILGVPMMALFDLDALLEHELAREATESSD